MISHGDEAMRICQHKRDRRMIWLSPAGRSTLEEWVCGCNSAQKWVWQARIVLLFG
jgi:hypothetical protein